MKATEQPSLSGYRRREQEAGRSPAGKGRPEADPLYRGAGPEALRC